MNERQRDIVHKGIACSVDYFILHPPPYYQAALEVMKPILCRASYRSGDRELVRPWRRSSSAPKQCNTSSGALVETVREAQKIKDRRRRKRELRAGNVDVKKKKHTVVIIQKLFDLNLSKGVEGALELGLSVEREE